MGERAPILVVVPLDCVGGVFFCMARCIMHIGANARVKRWRCREEAPCSCVGGVCRGVPPPPLLHPFEKRLICVWMFVFVCVCSVCVYLLNYT